MSVLSLRTKRENKHTILQKLRVRLRSAAHTTSSSDGNSFFFPLSLGSDRITPAHYEVKIRQVSATQHTVKTI